MLCYNLTARCYAICQLVDKEGKPIWGVAWLSTKVEDGILVNICNYRNEKMEFKIKDTKKTATDLVSGKRISLSSLSLSPLEVRFILLKK